MAELIVADASPLIVLARIGHLKILTLVAGKVIVPDAVAQECVQVPMRPGALEIEQAFVRGWLTRQPKLPTFDPVDVVGLGPGEAAAIGLALELGAPILIDDRFGRQVAFAHSLAVVGTLGVLLRAKHLGFVDAIGPLVDSLRSVGFFIAPALEQEFLRRAAEP